MIIYSIYVLRQTKLTLPQVEESPSFFHKLLICPCLFYLSFFYNKNIVHIFYCCKAMGNDYYCFML